MGNFMETSQGAPVKWALSSSMYVKSLRGRLNSLFVIFFRYLLLQTLRNDPLYVNQVIIPEQSGGLPLNWGNGDAREDGLMKELLKLNSWRGACAALGVDCQV